MCNSIKFIDQERAVFAWKVINETKGTAEFVNQEYLSYIKKMPMMIKNNGLGNTLAFFFSKKGEYEKIYTQIDTWLIKNSYKKEQVALIEYIINLNSDEYQQITLEIMTLINWMGKFAEGFKGKQDASN